MAGVHRPDRRGVWRENPPGGDRQRQGFLGALRVRSLDQLTEVRRAGSAPDVGLAVAAITLGAALQVGNGYLSPGALTYLSVALATTAVAVARPPLAWLEPLSDRTLALLLAAGLLLQFALLLTTPP